MLPKRNNDGPPWTGDDAAMARWLGDKLDVLLKADGAKARARRALPYSEEEKQALFPDDSVEGAIAAAEQRGDIGPLRRRLPEYARFLRLPERKRGARYLKDKATRRKDILNDPHDFKVGACVYRSYSYPGNLAKAFPAKEPQISRG